MRAKLRQKHALAEHFAENCVDSACPGLEDVLRDYATLAPDLPLAEEVSATPEPRALRPGALVGRVGS